VGELIGGGALDSGIPLRPTSATVPDVALDNMLPALWVQVMNNESLTNGHFCPIICQMNGNELLKRLKKIAKERNLSVKVITERGKGSHGTLYFGDKYTIIKDRKKEIGPGLLNKMLKDLGLDKSDL